MKERKLTEKESLEVITSMISRTKERYMMGDGNIMLMWGYLILTVTALIWILIATTHNQQIDEQQEPVIGATVTVKGTSTAAATDFDGNFTITVPSEKSTLVISYVGCLTAEVSADSPELKSGIVMKQDAELLDEVLVIGYGSVKKSDATGSVTAIKPDDLNRGSRVSVQDALVGKIAGVNVVS